MVRDSMKANERSKVPLILPSASGCRAMPSTAPCAALPCPMPGPIAPRPTARPAATTEAAVVMESMVELKEWGALVALIKTGSLYLRLGHLGNFLDGSKKWTFAQESLPDRGTDSD